MVDRSDEVSPFMLPSEVDALARFSPVTRWRREKLGLFPRRIKISSRKIAYRRDAVLAWARDPEAWGRENGAAA